MICLYSAYVVAWAARIDAAWSPFATSASDFRCCGSITPSVSSPMSRASSTSSASRPRACAMSRDARAIARRSNASTDDVSSGSRCSTDHCSLNPSRLNRAIA
ncbi:hypothetical protein [Glycomyces paridis]|uniref:Uncharacterized protein n=1 Tax=Glycomyces paridis TaxID=2126555 RepID=A0A4S8PCD1_9ACTN|nr:hypothetical protein [Glycomyces paridis]THV27983.1 hypothetical protein E9998_13430 [Glycomyces paridis]